MVVPLLAGPCRIGAYSLWNLSQDVGGTTIDASAIKAWLYVEGGISTIDDLMAYLVDYIVYGVIYGLIGASSTFSDYELTFFPSNVFCYQYNFYDDPTNANYAVPAKVASGDYETGTLFYSTVATYGKNQQSYPTQADITSCIAAYSGATAVCYSYTC